MKHNIKYVISLVFMFLLTQGAWADPAVTIIKQLNGSPAATASPGEVTSEIANGKCTLTVTPAEGNYVTKDFITVYSVVTGNVAQGPRRSPNLDNTAIEVTNKGANTDPTGVTTYEFTMPTDGSDAEVTVNFHSITTYNLFIGETQVTELNAADILGDGKVSFTITGTDAPVNTLTLNGAELTVPVKVGLPNLTIDIQGENSITTAETCLQKIDDAAPAVTFKSTSSPVGSLTLKTTGDGGVNTFGEYNVGSFSISEELTLIMKNSGYVYSNTYYFTDGTTKEAVFAPAYDIIVGEMPVTMGNADDIFGGYNDGQVSYDAENNVLTLNSADLYGEGKDIVYSGTADLTIALNGSSYVNSINYGGQGAAVPALTFTKVEGALPGTTMRTPSDFRTQFSTVNYEDWLGLYVDDSYVNDVFYDVMSKTPSIYGNWNGITNKQEVTIESKFDGTVKYSLTYADENLADKNKTNETFEEAFPLLGPATIKATITIGSETSPEETTYYFGVMPNPLKFEYDGGDTKPAFAATLYPSVEGVSFTPYSSPGSFATFSEEGEVTINGFGSGLAYASLNLPEERTFSVITDSIGFRMEVLPVKPTITKSDKITLSVPETLGGDNTSIYYKWEGDDAYTQYTEPFDVKVGTLYAQTRVSVASTVYASEDATAEGLKDIAKATVVGLENPATATYTGAAITPSFTVKESEDENAATILTDNYEVSYLKVDYSNMPQAPARSARRAPEEGTEPVDAMIDAGDYLIIITGKNEYGGTMEIPFEITQASLANVTIAAIADQTYTGADLKPTAVTVTLNGNAIAADEYTISYKQGETAVESAVNVGTYTVVLTSTGNNFTTTNTKEQTFTISQTGITDAVVTGLADAVFTGEAIVPEFAVKLTEEAENSLVAGTDYEVSYKLGDNAVTELIDVNTYTIVITGKGNYSGELTKTFSITALSLADATVTVDATKTYTYTGEAITPSVTVSLYLNDELTTLTADDYTVSYSNNINAALSTDNLAPTVTVTGKGNYTGSASATFTIDKATATITKAPAAKTLTYTGEALELVEAGTVSAGTMVYSMTIDGTFAEAIPTATNAGSYTVYYKVNGDDNYAGIEASETNKVTVTIGQAEITEVTLVEATLPYSGEAQTPTIAKVMAGDIEVGAEYYEITGGNAKTAVGEYELTVAAKTMEGNNFKGSAKVAWSIVNRTLTVGEDVQFADGQKWASFYTPSEDLELPEGVMAYIVTGVNESEKSVTVKAVNKVLKSVPMLLENNSTETTTNVSAEGNLLQVATEATAVSSINGTVYGLYNNAMMRVTTGTIALGKCYLVVNGKQNAPRLTITKDDQATGIESLTTALSEGEGAWYSLDGKKLQQKPTKKGIYIVNGKKMVVNN